MKNYGKKTEFTGREVAGFKETNQTMMATMNGWDGKSYKGEGRKFKVWYSTTNYGTFVMAGAGKFKSFHRVNFNKRHPVTGFAIAEYFYDISDFS